MRVIEIANYGRMVFGRASGRTPRTTDAERLSLTNGRRSRWSSHHIEMTVHLQSDDRPGLESVSAARPSLSEL